MSDAFDVRLKFTYLIEQLDATGASVDKAVTFFVKHEDHYEDLHSVILETLDKNKLNHNANIMFFIDSLCVAAQREGKNEILQTVQASLLRIIDAVAPNDGSGAANVVVIQEVLNRLRGYNAIDYETFRELDECVKERDSVTYHPALSPHDADDPDYKPASDYISPGGTYYKAGSTSSKVDKKAVEQRIEQDRERQKQRREQMWNNHRATVSEFDEMWEDSNDPLNEMMEECESDSEERKDSEMAAEQQSDVISAINGLPTVYGKAGNKG